MKELFSKLKKVENAVWLLDTCFLYWVFIHQKEHQLVLFCETNDVAVTTFTRDEVLFHAHDVPHQFRERFRKCVKNGLRLGLVEVDVSPGNPKDEVRFTHEIDPQLIQLVPDHSDAVIAAAAVKLGANILTRDKHHLFTVELENYFRSKGLEVRNNM